MSGLCHKTKSPTHKDSKAPSYQISKLQALQAEETGYAKRKQICLHQQHFSRKAQATLNPAGVGSAPEPTPDTEPTPAGLKVAWTSLCLTPFGFKGFSWVWPP